METIDLEKILKIIIGLILIIIGFGGAKRFKDKYRNGGFLGGIIIIILAGLFLILNQFINIRP